MTLCPFHKPFVDGMFNVLPEEYRMKNSLVKALVFISLFLLLLSPAGATCPLGYTVQTTSTPVVIGPYGTIYVESSPPGAVISVNGINHGHAPATITGLYPGTYTIRAELKGFQDFTTTASLSGPTRTSVYCPMVPDSTGNGIYVMSSPPRANVYLDGVLRGVAPLMLSNTVPGSHQVIVNLSGYDDWESTVVVPQSGTKTVAAVLDENDEKTVRGINVTSKPSGARVLLDSTERGVTPVTLNNIAAGIHILEIEYAGYDAWKSTVSVPDSGLKQVSVNLTPEPAHAPGWITVASHPGNASVTLDGNFAGRTPVNSTLNLAEIPPGEHTIVVVLSGYRSFAEKINVSPNLVSAVNATLVPFSGPDLKGSLSVISAPAGAAVFVDNASIGISPLTADDLPAGNHVVSLRMEGYEEYSVSILVSGGTTKNITATLMPVTPALHSPMLPLTTLGALVVFGLFFLHRRR
jgi:hypothetical protein